MGNNNALKNVKLVRRIMLICRMQNNNALKKDKILKTFVLR